MRAFFVVMTLFLAGCRAEPEPPQTIEAIVAAHVADDEPGAAVLVIEDGDVEHAEGYGLADLETERAITSETTFHLASVGKQMTAVAIMLLKQDGKLGYEDFVGD